MVIVNLLGQVCTLDRAPHTKETLSDFHEWCRVTRHPRIFRRLTGCQRTPGFWGVTMQVWGSYEIKKCNKLSLGGSLRGSMKNKAICKRMNI